MKVVMFCGGQGLRLREHSEQIPKPMVPIGYRPILWHVMKYYAHYGHKDFILCLGYKADKIKEYFLNYNEMLSNDFVMEGGDHRITLLKSDIDDWRITFVDTGMGANIGERLCAVRDHLDGEEMFLANYADVLTDAPLPDMIESFKRKNAIGMMLCVQPKYTFHLVEWEDDGWVSGISDVGSRDLWINGGYMIFRHDIFDYIEQGEELVLEPFRRLAKKRALSCYRHNGFWAPMDTLKEKQLLDDLHNLGQRPWCVWEDPVAPPAR